jgi:acetylornithine deacetylase/succinyl-diaminopimelate desuccinylase-like protein
MSSGHALPKPARLLRELIAIPSVNPAFAQARGSGSTRAGELSIAEFVAVTAARAGLDVELRQVLPGRPNVLAHLRPAGKARHRVLLVPHLDTVGVADESQFQPVVKGGRVHGRGACDTKGSIAAMLVALCELACAAGRPRETEVIFAGVIDEENAQAGSRALARSGLKSPLAIVGEPTRLQVVTAHKGSLWLELETRGRAAHGATPELGRNAVHEMARIVHLLQTAYVRQLQRRRHPLLGHASVSVGTIRGGTQPNIVPDHCAITIDRRILPGETESGVHREVRKLLHSLGLRADLRETKAAACLPLETDARLPLVRQFMRCAGQRKPLGVHFFCDAAVLSAGGSPSIVFGPGDIAQAHTTDEWVALDQLERARDLLFHFLKSLP